MNYSFEIEFSHPNVEDLATVEGGRLADAIEGEIDATFAQVRGQLVAMVDVDGSSFASAVLSSVSLFMSHGCLVERVLPDELVSIGEIARRRGKTRQWAANIVSGRRGAGGFPEPFSSIGPAGALGAHWRWQDVEAYFNDERVDPAVLVRESAFLGALNAFLEFRTRTSRVSREEQAAIVGLGEPTLPQTA